MIWHILRKDWRLLRRVVVGIALVNVVQRIMLSRAEQIADETLLGLARIFGLLALLSTAILIVIVVHQDPLPGLRQDWLVRPIQRRDLLLSKLLFVAMLVQGPIFLAEIAQGLIAGLPLAPSIQMALSRNLWMFLAMDLPCLTLAAVTANMTQAIGATLSAALSFVSVLGLYLFFFADSGGPPLNRWATIAWVAESAQTAWGVLVVAVVLTLLYRRRKIALARWTLGGAALIWILLEILPPRTAFAIQERFPRTSGAANSINISFDPQIGRWQGPPPNPDSVRYRRNVPERAAFLYIPMRVDGLGDDRLLLADNVTAHVTNAAGRAVELYQSEELLEIRQSPAYELIVVQEASYDTVKQQPLRLQIEYSLRDCQKISRTS